MKKSLLILSFIALVFGANAQIEFSVMGGYFLGGHVDYWEGRFDMDDAPVYNITASIPTMKGNNIEVSYSFTSSNGTFNPYSNAGSGYERTNAHLNTHYAMIGSYQSFKTGSPVTPFIGISIGASIFDYQYKNVSNVWRFAGSLGGGIKIDISEKIGIRLQGRLLMPMYFAGVGFYAGVGTGGASSGLSMNTGALAVQGDFSGGIIFKLK